MQTAEASGGATDYRQVFIDVVAALREDERVTFLDVVDGEPGSLCMQMTFADADLLLVQASPQQSHIDLEFELGPMPASVRPFALQLLALNAELACGEQSGFAIDADRSVVIYRCRHTLLAQGAHELGQKLGEVAALAVGWFDEWFPDAAVSSEGSVTAGLVTEFQQV